jgi:hypothetical protein
LNLIGEIEIEMLTFDDFYRYGSELVEVDSWSAHNWTVALARRFSHGDPNFWLGFNSFDDLRTNTLDSASGSLLSQYAGEKERS